MKTTIQLPIVQRFIDTDPNGPIRRILRAATPLEVMTRGGAHRQVPHAILDTGASYTMMSAGLARHLNIEIPRTPVRTPILTTGGDSHATAYDGEIRIRFTVLPEKSFRLYCVFLEHVPHNVPLLLGLNDVLDEFRFTFDGVWQREAPSGYMRLEPLR